MHQDITMCRIKLDEILNQGRLKEITIFTVAFKCELSFSMIHILRKFFRVARLHPFQLTVRG